MTFLDNFKAARRVSVPIIAVVTPDQQATIRSVADAFNNLKAPLLMWDICNAVAGINQEGKAARNKLKEEGEDETMFKTNMQTLGDCITRCIQKLPAKSILFVLNAHRFLDPNPPYSIQAIANTRDNFKGDKRTLVLLGPDFGNLPPELGSDVLVIDEPLPNVAAIGEIVNRVYRSAVKGAADDKIELPELTDVTVSKAVDALRGLPAFCAEQVTAMSITKEGILLDALWERKRQMIEATPGLSVWRGGESFAQIGGVENIKRYISEVLRSENAKPRGIVFVDEIEKTMAGAAGDSSGVSQALLELLLTHMQDKKAAGMIFIGPPGAAKSVVAKAAGAQAGIPTIKFEMSGMKGSYVGESERNMRIALKVVSAVTDDASLFIATCNSITSLPPELRRRFKLGTFFFDLPTDEERRAIWTIYRQRYAIATTVQGPVDVGWTGAEIEACCEVAWRLQISLVDAATFIVPVAISARESIRKLRESASNRYINASKQGLYVYYQLGLDDVETIDVETSRMMEVN